MDDITLYCHPFYYFQILLISVTDSQRFSVSVSITKNAVWRSINNSSAVQCIVLRLM